MPRGKLMVCLCSKKLQDDKMFSPHSFKKFYVVQIVETDNARSIT